MKKKDMRKYIAAALLGSLTTVGTLHAQKTAAVQGSQPVDVAVMFNAERAQFSYSNNFWMYGGSGELATQLKYHVALVVNVTGESASGIAGSNSFSKVMATAGPRYTLPLRHFRSRVFAEGLFGGVHGFNNVFPAIYGPLTATNAFAMQLGGGLDYSLDPTFAVRVLDVHYVRTDLPNGFSNRQSDVVLGTGIVWRPIDRSARR